MPQGNTPRGTFPRMEAYPSLTPVARHHADMETIYVALLEEGVDVWRPVAAHREGDSIYRITSMPSPDDETWQFPPGSLVSCEWRELSGGSSLVAVATV